MRVLKCMAASVALLSVALIAASCGNDTNETPPASTPTATVETDDRAARSGGEITVHYLEFQSFDPHYSAFAQDIGHQGMVWRGLYDIDADNRPYPLMAAAEPNVSADGLTYTVQLREGLVWSDGAPLTADDFVAGIQRTCSFAVAGQYQYLLSNVEGCDDYYYAGDDGEVSDEEHELLRAGVGVEAVDDHSIRIRLVSPQPTFTLILAMWVTWPVPTHVVEHPAGEWPEPAALVFNGPFVVESYQAGTQMVLVRNENYAGNMALLDRITLRYIDDFETANNAYRSGELDMAVANVANLSALQQQFPEELVSTAIAATDGLMMNLRHAPLDQIDVRVALSKAIDRETLVNVVLQGAHTPTTTWTPSDILDSNSRAFVGTVGFDPDGARAALARAGYPDGEGFPELGILVRDSGEPRTVAEFLQQQYREILDITVNIDVVDAQTRGQRFFGGDFDLFPGGFAQDYPDPENWLAGLFHSEAGMNFWGCDDPDIDALIEEARFNTNDAERRGLYRQVNELVVSRVCGIAPYHHPANHYLVSRSVGGARELSDSKDRVLPGDWAVEDWYLAH